MVKTFLIAGFGSIGKKHVDILQKLEPRCRIILFRHKKTGKSEYEEFYNLGEALKQRPAATIVANPTSEHMNIALNAAEKGSNLLIEKPLSHNLEGVNTLIRIANKKKIIISVGYNMRFLESLNFIKKHIKSNTIGKIISARFQVGKYLPDWHPSEDYSSLYSAKSELGGGVILTLSHEIDFARWLLGEAKEVLAISDKLSNLKIDVEDTADIMVKFLSKSVATIHMDYLQEVPTRTAEMIGEKGMISWQYLANLNKVTLLTKDSTRVEEFPTNDMAMTYERQMSNFLGAIEAKEEPKVNLKDGLNTLKVALAAKKSARIGRKVEL